MNLITWTRRPRPATRGRRATGLAVESIEKRLAPSPTLPLPPPHVMSTVAKFTPPDPCARLAFSFQRPETGLDFPPDPI